MLPVRGLPQASGSAALLRQSLAAGQRSSSPLAVPRHAASRQFSQLRRVGQAPRPWSGGAPARRLSPGAFESAAAVLPASVFAHRAGAARNLSLWPFGSKKPAADANAAAPAEPASPSLWDSPAKSAPSPAAPPAGAEPVVAAQAPAASPVPDAVASVPASSPSGVPDALNDVGFNGVLDMPEYVGYLKNDLGLDFGWGPTAMLQNLLEHLHITAGLEWWAAIAASAVLIRAALFWPTLAGAKYGARMQLLQKDPEFVATQNAFKAATAAGDQATMMRQRALMQQQMRHAGTSFLRTLAPPFLLIPLSYGMFRGLRAMAALPVPSLETGGIAWFTDLSASDPTYILPLTSAAITVVAMKLQQKGTVGPQNAALQKTILYVMTPFMFLCTMWLPAAVQWFFATFALASAAQGQLTLLPAVRRFAELPPLNRPHVAKSAKAVVDANWQAPQTRGGLRGMMDDALKNVGEVKSSFQSTMNGSDAEVARKKAEAYEQRRQREEEEKYQMRMEENRRRKLQRGKKSA